VAPSLRLKALKSTKSWMTLGREITCIMRSSIASEGTVGTSKLEFRAVIDSPTEREPVRFRYGSSDSTSPVSFMTVSS
jgi:hypothetical protein